MHVIEHAVPIPIASPDGLADRVLWIGLDDRGLELEVIGLHLGDVLLVIHVMPYRFRRQ